MAQAIVNESMETQQLTTTATTNGWPYTPPASTATGMLTVRFAYILYITLVKPHPYIVYMFLAGSHGD